MDKKCKKESVTLADALCSETRPEDVREWMASKNGNIANGFDRVGYRKKQKIAANAWILEKWIVKETGEVDGI